MDILETPKLKIVLGESLIKLWKELDRMMMLQKFFKILLDSNK